MMSEARQPVDRRRLVGAIEAGGTKFICAVGAGPDDVRASIRFPTTTPEETLGKAVAFFRAQAAAQGPLDAIGIGCFGPLDLSPSSPKRGYITSTVKPGWSDTDVAGTMRRALGVPVAFDTDVNAAVLAERLWGAGRDLEHLVYITVGTGIGGGILCGGRIVHGLVHPEVGHMRVPREAGDEAFGGQCSCHGGACVEGLASGPAIEARWGQSARDLPPGHPAWTLEAGYLATLCVNLTLTLSPQRIILGGGVMEQAQLFPLVHARMQERLNGYVDQLKEREAIAGFVVPPKLGELAGLHGALALGLKESGSSERSVASPPGPVLSR